MILKDDIPKKCSYTRMILYSLQHYKALQLHIRTITAIALCTNDVTKFRPPSRLRQTKSNSVREVGEMYANGE